MFVAGNFLVAVGRIVDLILGLYMWIVIARAVITWFRMDPYNPLVRTLSRLVDPLTYRISRIVPTRFGMVDVSSLILLLIIYFLRYFLVQVLIDAGLHMK